MNASRGFEYWGAVVFCAFIMILVTARMIGLSPHDLPSYIGTDTYSRMVRVRDLWAGGSWFNPVYDQVIPHGLLSHWTRPLDVLISVCALPFMLVMRQETALFWGGYVVAPGLGIVTAGLLAAALRRVLTPLQTAMTIVSLICVTPLLATFLPGRPDHYAALIPVLALIVWGLVLMATSPYGRHGATLVGIALPLAVWVNISGVLAALLFPVALGVRWLVAGGAWSQLNQRVAAVASATCLVILFVERPPLDTVSVVEFDRVSVWHLCVFLAIVLFWTGIRTVEQRWPAIDRGAVSRLVPAIPLALVGVGALLVAFPQVLAPDHGIAIDPLYVGVRLLRIEEYYPLIDAADFESAWTVLSAVATQTGYLLPLIISVVGMLILLVRGGPERRWVWGSLLVVAVTMLLVTWPPVAAWMPMILFFLLPGQGLIAAMAVSACPRARLLVRMPLRVALASAVLVGPFVVQAITHTADKEKNPNVLTHCSVDDLTRWLGATLPPAPPLNIMALADMGAALMYWTPHRVYAIPNHRLQPGFATRLEVISAPTDDDALARATDAQVDILVICDVAIDTDVRDPTLPRPPFKTRLLQGDEPDWLTPLPTPDSVSDAVRVFRVHRAQDGES